MAQVLTIFVAFFISQFGLAQITPHISQEGGNQTYSKVLILSDTTLGFIENSFDNQLGFKLQTVDIDNKLHEGITFKKGTSKLIVYDAQLDIGKQLFLCGAEINSDTSFSNGFFLIFDLCNKTSMYHTILGNNRDVRIEKIIRYSDTSALLGVLGLNVETASLVHYDNGNFNEISSFKGWVHTFSNIIYDNDIFIFGTASLNVVGIAGKLQKAIIIRATYEGTIKNIFGIQTTSKSYISGAKSIFELNDAMYLFQANRNSVYNPQVAASASLLKVNPRTFKVNQEYIINDTSRTESFMAVSQMSNGEFATCNDYWATTDGKNIWAKVSIIDTAGNTVKYSYINKKAITSGYNYCFVECIKTLKNDNLVMAGRIYNTITGEDPFYVILDSNLQSINVSHFDTFGTGNCQILSGVINLSTIQQLSFDETKLNYVTNPITEILTPDIIFKLAKINKLNFKNFKIHPIPCDDVLTISENVIDGLRLQVYTSEGEKIGDEAALRLGNTPYYTGTLSDGIYYLVFYRLNTVYDCKKIQIAHTN